MHKALYENSEMFRAVSIQESHFKDPDPLRMPNSSFRRCYALRIKRHSKQTH